MDSLTQLVLGASVAALVAPPCHRRTALALGAALGTLPDLDVFIDFGGAVDNFTRHRGFSHSLFVLAPFALLLWLALRHWWAPVRESPSRWLGAIALALLTHPLLDAHTAYGTQLFWPLHAPPVKWATIFIIDPLFTLPLLAAGIHVLAKPRARLSAAVLGAALTLSSLYLGWTWVAQGIVNRHADASLVELGLAGAPRFVTPTPFNTLLWRVVVMTDEGYLEGFDSLVQDEGPMAFARYASDTAALAAAARIPAVQRLRWFAGGFVRAEVVDGQLLLADLRMGQEPVYVFTHRVARRGNPRWSAVETERLPVDFADRSLRQVWRRIWWHDGP
jgi:inner membrane protein